MDDNAHFSTLSPFSQICAELVEIHNRKSHDYGNAFSDVYNQYRAAQQQAMADGYAAGLLSTKVNRINSLLMANGSHINYESIDDSLIDLASYAIMYLIERRHQ